MLRGSQSLYRMLRRRETSKKDTKKTKPDFRALPRIVDPSFELLNHQQQIHDEYHREFPSSDCIICTGQGVPKSADSFHSPDSFTSSPRHDPYERCYSLSAHSQSSEQSSSPTTPSNSTSPDESLVPSPLFTTTRREQSSGAQSPTCIIVQLPRTRFTRLSTQEKQKAEPIPEGASPPSYESALADSPTSSTQDDEIEDFRPPLESRLTRPFDYTLPFDSLPELQYCSPTSPQTYYTISPITPQSSRQGYLQYHSRSSSGHESDSPPPPPRADDGLGHRDDLVKRGLII